MTDWFTVEAIDNDTFASVNTSIGRKLIVICYAEQKKPF